MKNYKRIDGNLKFNRDGYCILMNMRYEFWLRKKQNLKRRQHRQRMWFLSAKNL